MLDTPHETATSLANATPENELGLLDFLALLVEHLRSLVLLPLLAGLLALAASFAIAPTFTAVTKFMPPQQQQSGVAAMLQSLGSLGSLAGASGALKNPADQYVAFLKSQSVEDAMIERFHLQERYNEKYRQDTRKQLEKMSRISAGKDGLIAIEVDDKDPPMAAQMANAYVQELGTLLNRLAVTEAQQRRVFFEKQLLSAKENLIKAEVALKASGVNSSALKASPQAAVEGLAKLKAAITAQEVKIASMRGYLTENAPDVKQAFTELSAMRSQMSRAETEDPSAASGGSDYIAKFRDYKYHETLFELFAKQYEIARVDESREGALIQVVDVAQPPEKKSKPQRSLIAVAVALAVGVLLLLFIFIRQALQSAKNSPDTAAKIAALRLAWSKALGRC